jgi:hypothetical protein
MSGNELRKFMKRGDAKSLLYIAVLSEGRLLVTTFFASFENTWRKEEHFMSFSVKRL